jgi:hypothetical protein
MQFNFLGGNTQRDTLQNALGQRNPVLESQLDFSKSAFTTGVQGVGNTMREAMRLGQAETESVRRDKTTTRESMLSRQKDQDLLTQRLEADKTAYERSQADQDTRDKNNRQNRLDDSADAARMRGEEAKTAHERELERIRASALSAGKVPKTEEEIKNEQRATNEIDFADWNSKWVNYIGSITDPSLKQQYQAEYERIKGLLNPKNPFNQTEMSAIIAKIKEMTPGKAGSNFTIKPQEQQQTNEVAAVREGVTLDRVDFSKTNNSPKPQATTEKTASVMDLETNKGKHWSEVTYPEGIKPATPPAQNQTKTDTTEPINLNEKYAK